jgi:enediyne biosynthesis protein E4
MNIVKSTFLLLLFSITFGCKQAVVTTEDDSDFQTKFVEHSPQKSGLGFSNDLDDDTIVNPFNYINSFNGGGVAAGDINNDGLPDIYFTGNMVSSKLYLNKGNFEFDDITDKAGVGTTGWCTGVTMADVNNDGWLDIYVCRSYYDLAQQRFNLLFINNQDGTFSEKATEYGVFDPNYSIGASFFDYDRDGDPDLFVANHPRYKVISSEIHYNFWKSPVIEFSNRLYRNEGNTFTDVTEAAGVLSYGHTLGVTTTDIDSDGWPDIYVSVDHEEPDIVYHNNGDGTFANITGTAVKETSRASMGIDAGDVNHDLYPDIVVVEMLSENHYREKVFMSMQTVKWFEFLVDTAGYKYYQMRNFLHLNNGNNTFSDIGQLAGIHKSDWSWSTFFIDADNDGWQDIFISNGFYRDIYNRDLLRPIDSMMMLLGDDMATKNKIISQYAKSCSQTKLPNYFFRNMGGLEFKNYSSKAGLDKPTISSGATYADFDIDGDLDVVISNVGDPATLLENQSSGNNQFLRFKMAHDPHMASLGTKVILKYGGQTQMQELLTTRGYQSSCEPVVHFGMGKVTVVDSVYIIWPDGKEELLTGIQPNQILTVEYKNATGQYAPPAKAKLVEELQPAATGIDFVQNENYYHDYDDQVLLPHKMSQQGPFTATGDVNGDRLDDVYIGAPAGQAGVLYVQAGNGKFLKKQIPGFETDKGHEDGHSAFFDADSDGDLDLLVASGGYEFPENDPKYQPRLYVNNGKGSFEKRQDALPEWHHSSSCVRPVDFDGDSDMDVFIGGLLTPKKYPEPGRSGLFINDGKGQFFEQASETNPALSQAGMVKDALWTDVNQDEKPDLIVVGEWMPVSIWVQQDGELVNKTDEYLPDSPVGWWNVVRAADLDGNGLEDYVIGNLGLNYKYKASKEKPFSIYGKDFDNSNTYDIVLGAYYGDTVFPVRGRSCSSQQMPEIKSKFPTFKDFAMADVNEVYGSGLKEALHYEADQFASIILYQEEPGKFSIAELPVECQTAPVNGIVITDINKDGKQDILTGGNFYQSEIETGRADAGTGNILINNGERTWKPLKVHESGLYIANDVKSIQLVELGKNRKPAILVGNNSERCQVIAFKNNGI